VVSYRPLEKKGATVPAALPVPVVPGDLEAKASYGAFSFCYLQSSQARSSPELEGRKQVSINTDRSASSEPELCGPQRSALGCRTPFRRLMQMDAWHRGHT